MGEVEFSDNANVLNLIKGRMGLISVLNEEYVCLKGNLDFPTLHKTHSVNLRIINVMFHSKTQTGVGTKRRVD